MKITGEKNCRKIYGNKYEKLIYNVNSFSPELSEWLVIEGYGKIFSRKHLSIRERELLVISVLSSLRFESQLYSHIKGALRLKIDKGLIKEIIIDTGKIKKGGSQFGMRIFNQVIEKE